MSSILKALKKLEDQTVEENATLVWPDTLGAKKHHTLSKNRKKYTILAIISIIILVGIGGLILDKGHDVDKRIDMPINIMTLEKPTEDIIPPYIMKEDLKLEKIQERDIIIALAKETDDTREIPIEIQKPVHTVKNTFQKKDTAIPIIREKPSPPKIERPALKEMEDPRIDLQAIAWAPEPENSFAVINNRIIREGNTIEGITILQIGKDAVSFKEGSSKWQQKFRVK